MTDETGQLICRECKQPGDLNRGIHIACRLKRGRVMRAKQKDGGGQTTHRQPQRKPKPIGRQKLHGNLSPVTLEVTTAEADAKFLKPPPVTAKIWGRRNLTGQDGWD